MNKFKVVEFNGEPYVDGEALVDWLKLRKVITTEDTVTVDAQKGVQVILKSAVIALREYSIADVIHTEVMLSSGHSTMISGTVEKNRHLFGF